jgi:hypothetical protein
LGIPFDCAASPSLVEPAREFFGIDANRARSDANTGNDLCGDQTLYGAAAYLELLGHLLERQKAPLSISY